METKNLQIDRELITVPDLSCSVEVALDLAMLVDETTPPFQRTAPLFVDRRRRQRKPFVYRHRSVAFTLQRIRDVCLASLALVVAVPLLALAAFAIWCEDRGPVLFTQRRVGRFERLFTIYKLRTMSVALCNDGSSPTSSSDSRITRVGRVLRKTSIDELPQLLNIIRGDMTLVGPRPEMPFIVRRYARWQHLRHLETPGLTGLWQISYRSTVPLYKFEATAVDLEYIERSSPSYDLTLIFRTFAALVRSKGAY